MSHDYLRLVDESSTLAVWWGLSGCGILQAFDDGLQILSAKHWLSVHKKIDLRFCQTHCTQQSRLVVYEAE